MSGGTLPPAQKDALRDDAIDARASEWPDDLEEIGYRMLGAGRVLHDASDRLQLRIHLFNLM